MLLKKYNEFGSAWAKIKNYLPGRSKNATKYRFSLLKKNKVTLDSLQNPTDVDNNAPRNVFAEQNMMAAPAPVVSDPNYFTHIQAPVAINLSNIVNTAAVNPDVNQEEQEEQISNPQEMVQPFMFPVIDTTKTVNETVIRPGVLFPQQAVRTNFILEEEQEEQISNPQEMIKFPIFPVIPNIENL